MPWSKLVDRLRGCSYRLGLVDELDAPHVVEFAEGLDDREIARTEIRYGFTFPADLRALLQTALPTGRGFPDWRGDDEADLRARFAGPKHGLLWDVEHNAFWLDEWGRKPSHLDEQKQVAAAAIDAAPVLIPVFLHRRLPAEPLAPGNPVFSVHQSDIICYGRNLAEYLELEFLSDGNNLPKRLDELRPIRFWSALM